MLIYCVVGIECNIYNIPIKMSILGSFTESEKAIEFRNKQKQYTTVDIVFCRACTRQRIMFCL